MENIKNKEINQTPKYFEPYNNGYSLKNLQTNFGKDDKNKKIMKKILNINQNNYLINNLQTKKSFDKLRTHSLKNKGLKKFYTQRNLKRININMLNNINFDGQEDYNIVFAKKTDIYSNNNGKKNQEENQNLLMKNDTIAKKLLHKNNDIANNFKEINSNFKNNYNPKFYSINNNRNVINDNLLLENNIITKKISNNIIKHNYDLNSTLPNKTINHNNFTINNMINLDGNLPNNHKINRNSNNNKFLNDSILNPQNFKNTKNKKANDRPMTDYKTKNKVSKNDLSWDYGIGILNKGDQMNFYQKKNSGVKGNYIMNNYFSERKQKPLEYDTDNFNYEDDDIDDKEIDEIVDNLNLSFFEDEKKNNTVILKDKGFSDDSLSDIAGDIVKTFQETENDDLNVQETVPSSSNPEMDGITSSTTDIQYNNNFQSQKKIIYETKSTIKPTIVNNFFISNSGEQSKNNSLNKDINYNLFVVNEFNNKINTNNIPTLVTQTYKSPNILREEKNNQKQNNINDFEDSEISDLIYNRNEVLNNLNNNNIINNQNIIIGLNYSNQNNNLNSNINNKTNNNEQFNPNNFNQKIDTIFGKNNYKNNNNQNNNQNFNNKQILKLNSNILLNDKIKKNTNEINDNISNIRDLLSSQKNNLNNIEVVKENSNSFNEFDKKHLLKNKLKNLGANNIDNINNFSYNKSKNNNNYAIFQNNDEINIKRITNNMAPINKNNYFKSSINLNRKSIPKNNKKNDLNKNNILTKTKRHISFNLNNNILIKFNKDDFITKSEITTQSGEAYIQSKKNMNLYNNKLELIKPKPIIKTFLSKDIKINKDYISVENLPERQILPDLYDDFEEDEIKSLERPLERQVDKILH